VTRKKSANLHLTSQTPSNSSKVSKTTTASISNTSQNLSNSSKVSKTTTASTLNNTFSKDTVQSEVSTPPNSSLTTAAEIQPNPSPLPDWPIFNEQDDTVPKGLPFFRAKRSNIVNFKQEPNTAWKLAYGSSEILSWTGEEEHRGAVNLFVIGSLRKASLVAEDSEYDPAYRLDLALEQDTMTSLQKILSTGPLKDSDFASSPLRGHSASFGVKLKTLQKADAPNTDIGAPFPFLFDGTRMAKGRRTLLKNYPVDQLSENDLLAVETNISSYDIPAKNDSLGRVGYSFSLRSIYFLAKGTSQSSPKSLKRPGGRLVSPRKNKKAGQLAVFSDED
jgi:hypothetical protein